MQRSHGPAYSVGWGGDDADFARVRDNEAVCQAEYAKVVTHKHCPLTYSVCSDEY